MHEHKVPDLHIPLIVLWKRLVFPGHFGSRNAQIVEDLRAWTTRPGITHLPEVILGGHAEDALLGHAGFDPEPLRFVVARHALVAFKDRHIQARCIDPKPVRRGQQLPRIRDRFALEVVAKAEVPEHLKERVVTPRESHIFQIVVLAARAHAFLRTRRARVVAPFRAKEHILELVHARVGKQQGRIVGRNQRRGVHPTVPLAFKKPQKIFTNLVAGQGAHRA